MINNLKNYIFLSLFFNLNLFFGNLLPYDLSSNINLVGFSFGNLYKLEKQKNEFLKRLFRKDNFYEDIKGNYLYSKNMIDEYYRNYKKFDLLKNTEKIEMLHERQKFLLEKIQNIILYQEELNKFFSDKKSILNFGKNISEERKKILKIYWKYQIDNQIFIKNLINNRISYK